MFAEEFMKEQYITDILVNNDVSVEAKIRECDMLEMIAFVSAKESYVKFMENIYQDREKGDNLRIEVDEEGLLTAYDDDEVLYTAQEIYIASTGAFRRPESEDVSYVFSWFWDVIPRHGDYEQKLKDVAEKLRVDNNITLDEFEFNDQRMLDFIIGKVSVEIGFDHISLYPDERSGYQIVGYIIHKDKKEEQSNEISDEQ